MSKTDPRVCVAIPTFNSAGYITGLLTYISTQRPYRIYVLDDASTDDTVTLCRKVPGITVIAGDRNVGPTRNRNRVLGEDIGDILVFIDDDMQWRAGNMMATIRKRFTNPGLGALGFAIFTTTGKELWFGNEWESNPLFFWARRPFTSPLKPVAHNQPLLDVQWVLEGAFAIRSDLFKSLGGFDKRFTRYQEGPDLCRRVRQKKYTVGYTHDLQFTHTKPLNIFRLRHVPLYLKSGIIWHAIHRGKVKNQV